jgi:membrane fusion protein (multidrug efflux system)
MGGLLLAALVLVWVAWFVLGKVTLYEVSCTARLETKSAAHPVAAVVGGRVVETSLRIGQDVCARQVLVMLESEAELRGIREKRARHDALLARLEAVQREIQAEEEVVALQQKARDVAAEEGQAQIVEATTRARLAEQQAETLGSLRSRSAASDEEFRRAKADAEARRATVQAVTSAATRVEQDRLVQEKDRTARLAKLQREAVELKGEAEIEQAAIHRLEHDIELRTIRAPVSGRVGEIVQFPVGSVVRAGEKIACIIPPGEPRAVAQFPVAAVGRIRPGQPVRLRLDGFPWTQYGTVPATIADVGNEPSGGLIRIELSLTKEPSSTIPLEHGIPGSAEVEVGRVSPAVLVLRAAGQFFGAQRF